MTNLDSGGTRPRIDDHESLRRWLDALPSDRQQQAAVVIAARAALRVAPLISRGADGQTLRQLAWLPFAVAWASALARVAVKYPTRANDLRAASAAAAAAAAASSYTTSFYATSRDAA
jgi:hypothetical protein